ncbi:flavin reductase like domain-containing protein [Sphaerosporella brunnea]|uniref:Flavin reductase like domain-containing protein n=1 Tax=Sphaerosporella brunnea TaxID=1250544 RepID=A0A5J5EZ78_9PEZI|nr:flavin reductase like domain-containing protein [Sphaerosporella brunnea]
MMRAPIEASTARTFLRPARRKHLPLPRLRTNAPLLPPPPQQRRSYSSSSPPPPLSELSEALRKSMRLLPHPVAILTTSSAASTPGVGITLSTLTCLSLSPDPLVSFNIKLPSSTSAHLHSHPSRSFCLHLLSASPHAAFLAESFAQLNARRGEKVDPWTRLLGGVDVWEAVPMLGGADGVVVRLRCRGEKVVTVADHEIWVGKVFGVEELVERSWGDARVALGYADQRFRGVGSAIWPQFAAVEVSGGRWVEIGEEFGGVEEERRIRVVEGFKEDELDREWLAEKGDGMERSGVVEEFSEKGRGAWRGEKNRWRGNEADNLSEWMGKK